MAAGATTAKGVNITKLDATPKQYPASSFVNGRVRVFYDQYTAAALGIGAQIKLARVPAGAVILPESRIAWDALGANVQLTVGDSDDTARFMSVADGSVGAALQANDCGRFKVIGGIGYQYTCEKDILVSTNDQNATGTIKMILFYTLGD